MSEQDATPERAADDTGGGAAPAALDAECRRVLGSPPDEISPLAHGVIATVTTGVWVVRAGGTTAVVKVVAPRSADPLDASRQPASFRYWRREIELVRAPALHLYREAGLRPPTILAVVDRGAYEVALWEEAFDGPRGDTWAVGQFEDAARRLGFAQGVLAVAGPVAAHPAQSRGFLPDYLAEKAAVVAYELLERPEAWARPAIHAALPAGLDGPDGPLARLHREQAAFLGWVASAPRTLAHLDVWPLNLFARADGFGLVDWAFAGDGALGEDPGNLVFDAVLDLLHPASLLPDLDVVVYRGYLDGLNEAGWDGDERLVRLAMCASAVKYDWLAPSLLRRAGEAALTGYGGQPVTDVGHLFGERGRALAFIVERAEEARRIAADL